MTTPVTITNKETKNETKEHTPWVLSGKAAGATIEVECTNLFGEGWIENVTTLGVMESIGTLKGEFTTCKVLKVKNCAVVEPIKLTASVRTESAGEEMWIDFTEDGGPLASITFSSIPEMPKCVLDKVTLPVEGTVKGTTNGATLNVNTGENNLKFGANAADLMGVATLRMTGGNPIAYTTTEP